MQSYTETNLLGLHVAFSTGTHMQKPDNTTSYGSHMVWVP